MDKAPSPMVKPMKSSHWRHSVGVSYKARTFLLYMKSMYSCHGAPALQWNPQAVRVDCPKRFFEISVAH